MYKIGRICEKYAFFRIISLNAKFIFEVKIKGNHLLKMYAL